LEDSLLGTACQTESSDVELLMLYKQDFDQLTEAFPLVRQRIEAIGQQRVRCSTLQHTATHCSTLQHTATHCDTLQHMLLFVLQHVETIGQQHIR